MVRNIQWYVIRLLRSYHCQAHFVIEGVRQGADQLGSNGLEVCLLVEELQGVGSLVADLEEVKR